MPTLNQPLFSDSFLRSRWAGEYAQFRGSELDTAFRERFKDWAGRRKVRAEGSAPGGVCDG